MLRALAFYLSMNFSENRYPLFRIRLSSEENLMNETVVIAPVRKTIRVNAPIAHAFEVFTSGLTRWWPHSHGVGQKPIQKVLMEPRLGGRWLEIAEDGTQTSVATVTLWERPHRLGLGWPVNAQRKPDLEMKSEGHVRVSAH